MPRKNILRQYQTITNGDMSGASITSSITNIQFLDNVGVQLNWSGSTPIGTIVVQVSADHAQDAEGNVTVAGNWISLPVSISVSGNTGSGYFDLNQLSSPWIRVVYTKTSGTGTLNGYVTGKEV